MKNVRISSFVAGWCSSEQKGQGKEGHRVLHFLISTRMLEVKRNDELNVRTTEVLLDGEKILTRWKTN